MLVKGIPSRLRSRGVLSPHRIRLFSQALASWRWCKARVRRSRFVLFLPGKRAIRRLIPSWPAPCSEPIPALPTWSLREYVAWRIHNDRDTRLIRYEDKLAIKKMAKRLKVPFVEVLTRLDYRSVDIDRHPCLQRDRFVLKMSHGWNDLVFVQRLGGGRVRLSGRHLKGECPTCEANNRIRSHFAWWSTHVHSPDEWAVSMVWPRVLFAEPYLPLNDDYKVFVVRGRAEIIMALTGRWEGEREWGGFFDRDWRLLGADDLAEDLFGASAGERLRAHFPRPARLQTLLSYAERMAPEDLTFVRLDFFQLPNGEFVLGEGAAYSAGGGDHAKPQVEQDLGRIFWRALHREEPPASSGTRR